VPVVCRFAVFDVTALVVDVVFIFVVVHMG